MLRGLYTAYTGMLNEQYRMDIMSNNLANADTVGFKKEGSTSQAYSEVMAVKIKIGSAFKRAEVDYMDVRGRNLVTGLPKTIRVSSEETEEALRETTSQIIDTIHSVLEKTPPELAADIADRGIVLTGGGSLLRGLEDLVESRTGINTMTAEDPMTAVAIGTGKYVEFLAGYREDI